MPYPATPTLSVEAVQDREIELCAAPLTSRLDGALGGCVSVLEQAAVLAGPVASARFETFPAASKASNATVYVVPQLRPVYWYERAAVVPAAAPFRNAR